MTPTTRPPIKTATKEPSFVAACEAHKPRTAPAPSDHRDIQFLTSGKGCFRKYRRGW